MKMKHHSLTLDKETPHSLANVNFKRASVESVISDLKTKMLKSFTDNFYSNTESDK